VDAAIADPALKGFRDRVTAAVDPAMPVDGVDMTIVLKDGRKLEKRVRDCIGSKGRPMTDQELETKFIAQAEPVIGKAAAERLVAQTWRTSALADAAVLIRLASG
jgi:2-methylcitrate dehydratase PrpD